MSRWFRHYAGMMRDEKLVGVALRAKQPVERVIWVWGAILESAAEINDAGRYEFDAAEVAYFLRADEADIAAILGALTNASRLADGVVVNWRSRQFQADRTGGTSRSSDGINYVYVVGTTWNSVVKIGFSKNPWARLTEFQTGSSEKLSVLATFRTDDNSGIDIHTVLKVFRQHGEWFALPPHITAILKDAPKGTKYVDIVAQLRSSLLRSATPTTTEAETETETDKPSLRSGARKRATRIGDDWKPSSEDQEFAKGLGLKDAEIDRQAARFLDFWKSKPGQGGTKLDWPATWRNWIRTEAEKLGRSPPEPSTPCVKNKFYAEFGTAQLDAWDLHNRQTKGASLPRDKRGGWLVDAEWPPGARDSPQEQATSMN